MVRKSVEADARIVLFLSEQTHSDLIICSQYQSKRNLVDNRIWQVLSGLEWNSMVV